jgi:hypothetical protein
MAKRKTSAPSLARSAGPLYREIRAVLESARSSAYRAVNTSMIQAYWQVGRLIVEHEQGGAKRAAYGEAVLEALSKRLMAEFGRGFDVTNLRKMRQFYRMFEIRDALRLESGKRKRDAVPPVSGVESIRHLACDALSWTHYRLLMQVEDPETRQWYMREAVEQHWSTRQLDRQISVFYYERLLSSRRKIPVRKEAAAKLADVIVPANLRKQWSQELADNFYLPSAILENRSFNQAIRAGNLNPFKRDEIVLCSYQFARAKEPYLMWFEAEMNKLDHWAEERRASLKGELDELDETIKETKKAARLAPNLPEKLERQRTVRQLESKRMEAWKTFDEASREIERQKDALLDEISRRLEQRIEQESLFTLRWSVV